MVANFLLFRLSVSNLKPVPRAARRPTQASYDMPKDLTVRKVPKHSTMAQSGMDSRKFATGLHMPMSMHKATIMEAATKAPSTEKRRKKEECEVHQTKKSKVRIIQKVNPKK